MIWVISLALWAVMTFLISLNAAVVLFGNAIWAPVIFLGIIALVIGYEKVAGWK